MDVCIWIKVQSIHLPCRRPSVSILYLLLQALQEDLKQAHRLAEMYREQCITMETELSQIREEGDVGREIFKVRPA